MRKIIKRKKLTESVSMNFSANGDTTNDIMDILHKITNLSKPAPVTQAMMPKAGPMMPMFKTVDAVRDYADSAGDKYADEVDEAPVTKSGKDYVDPVAASNPHMQSSDSKPSAKSDPIGDMIKTPGFGSSNAPQPTSRPSSGSSDMLKGAGKDLSPAQDTNKPYVPSGPDDTYNGAPEESLGEIMKLAGLKHDHLVDEDEEGSGDASAATAQSSAPAPAPEPIDANAANKSNIADNSASMNASAAAQDPSLNQDFTKNPETGSAPATASASAGRPEMTALDKAALAGEELPKSPDATVQPASTSGPAPGPTPGATGGPVSPAERDGTDVAKSFTQPADTVASAADKAGFAAKANQTPPSAGKVPDIAAPLAGGAKDDRTQPAAPVGSGRGNTPGGPTDQAGRDAAAANRTAPAVAPEKFGGTIKDFQKQNPGATVGQAMNAIQGKTAIAGGANDPAKIAAANQAKMGNAQGPAAPVYDPGKLAQPGKPAAAPGAAPKPATATGGAPAPKPAAAPGGVKPVSQGGPVPTPPPRPAAAAASTAPKPAPAAKPAVSMPTSAGFGAAGMAPAGFQASGPAAATKKNNMAGSTLPANNLAEDISAFNRIMELSGSKRRMKEQSASLGFNAPIKAMTMPQAAVSTSTDSKSLGNSKSQIDTDQKSGSTPTVTTGNLDTQQPSTAPAAPAAASTPAVKPTSEPSGSAELPTMTLGNVGGGGLGAFTSGQMPGTGIQAPNTGDAPPVTWSADALTDPERSDTATAQPLDASGKTGADTPLDSGSSNNQNRSNQGQGNQGGGFNNMLAAVLSGALGGALGGRGGGGYYAQPSRAAYYPQRGAFHPQMPRTVYQPRQIFGGGGGGRPSFGGGAPSRGGFSGGGRGGRREESVGEEFANEPNPKHADIDYMNMMLAGGLNRPKKTFPKVAKGDNPMQAVDEAVLKNLVSSYQKMINGKDS